MADKPYLKLWLLLGAFAFLCITAVLIMTARALNYEEYQRQQHAGVVKSQVFVKKPENSVLKEAKQALSQK